MTAALFTLILLVGGAGVSFPLLQMLLILGSLALAGWMSLRPAPFRVTLAKPLIALLAACFLLPLLQLIPLPPGVWHALPGREQAQELDRLIGWTLWRPWTLDVEGTVRAWLVMIPGAVIFIACLRRSTAERLNLLWITVGVALLSAILGIAQAASGGRFTPFPSSHSGFPIGLFVNRNHQAVLLLAAMPIAAALGALRLAAGKQKVATVAIALSVIAIFAITAIATTSRMSLILLPVMLGASLALLFLGQSIVRLILPSMLALLGLAALIWIGGGLSANLARFQSLGDSRFSYWADVEWALGHYGLAGTGIGTFIPVQKSAESLESVTAAILNHAHNDYIELLLEGGLAAAILIGLFFVILVLAGVRKFRAREGRERMSLAAASAVGLLAILLFSLVDYPLRMPAIAAVFALLVSLILPSRRNADEPSATATTRAADRRFPVGRAAAVAGLTAIAIVAVEAGVSARQLLAGKSDYAAGWAPWSVKAHEEAAGRALFVAGDAQGALSNARAAVRLSPIDAPSIRTLGILSGLNGDRRASGKLMEMAATLGWRDPITNLWAIDTARRTNDPVKAVQRAEANFRQGLMIPEATAALLLLPDREPALKFLVRDLQTPSDWRQNFLRASGEVPDAALPFIEQLFLALDATKAPATTYEAEPLMDRLARAGRGAERQRLWLSLHRQSLIENGGFERTGTYRGPEVPDDWEVSSDRLNGISIDRPGFGGAGNALRLFHASPETPLIGQRLMLEPGSYRLLFKIRSKPGSGTVLQWGLYCLSGRGSSRALIQVPDDSRWRSTAVPLTVPFQNCPDQRLVLERLGDANSGEIWLDSIALVKAS